MKIAVIGAGVIAVTIALELASHGHDVVVFEKGSGIAQQASFATAGFIGPAMINAWTAPGLPFKTLRKCYWVQTRFLSMACQTFPCLGFGNGNKQASILSTN